MQIRNGTALFIGLLTVMLAAGCGPSAPASQPSPAPTPAAAPSPATAPNPTEPAVPATQPAPAEPQPRPQTQPTTAAETPVIPEGVTVNTTAINFQLQTLNGKTISLKELRGKPILLNFWATWCPPCIAEMPSIQLVNYEHQGEDVVILTVDILGSRPSETPSNLATFMQKNEYTFPVLLDTDGKVTKSYFITNIPTTFLIDKDGIIRYKLQGPFLNKAAIDNALKLVMP